MSPRILIVEDDPDIRSLLQRTFDDADIASDAADSGTDGLWMAREHDYGCIVLDILLPGMNGYEVCRNLRSETNPVPIIMLTAKSGEFDEADGLDLGADDYLRKPFSPTVLVSRVRALLRRGPATVIREELQRGSVTLDPVRRECRLNDTPIELTAKEASVLEAVMRSGDDPISRPALLQAGWGHDFDGDPNVVDVYIGYLRRKLGKSQIETIRGLGFRVPGGHLARGPG